MSLASRLAPLFMMWKQPLRSCARMILPFVAIALAAGGSSAAPMISGPVSVTGGGVVIFEGVQVGKVPLPPGVRAVTHSIETIAKQKILRVKVTAAGAPVAGELVTTLPPGPRLIFSGATGPQGVDREWERKLQVDAGGVLLFQGRGDATRCDGDPVYLFPRLFDFKAWRFRPVAPIPRPTRLTELVATRKPPAALPGEPLNTFRLMFASSSRGDEGRAVNLTPPTKAEDGRPETAWAESLGGAGLGEFLTARRDRSPYKLVALRLIPGQAENRRTFGRANRIRSLILALSPGDRYRITFPRDPLHAPGKVQQPYWVVLPKKVDTRCATIIIERVYPGTLARGRRSGGRTAISELRFFTELEFSGGLKQVVADLRSKDDERGSLAVRMLSRLKARGITLAVEQIPTASPKVRGRILKLLARGQSPTAAAPLASILPLVVPRLQEEGLEAIVRHGQRAVPLLVPILRGKDEALAARVAPALALIGGGEARAALTGQAGAGTDRLRAAVASALSRFHAEGDIRAVLEAIGSARAARRRADLVLALSKMARRSPLRNHAAVSLADLWRALARPGKAAPEGPALFELRYRLVTALGRLAPDSQLPVLMDALGRKEPVLRWMAMEQIKLVRSVGATRAILAALADGDPRVRAAAALALSRRRGLPSIGKALADRLLKERWNQVALSLSEALGHHCSAGGVDALKKTILKGVEGVDMRALLSLSRCKPPGLDRELLALAKSDTWRGALRRRALKLLTPAMAKSRSAELLRLFDELRRRAIRSHGEERMATFAAAIIARIGSATAASALADALALDPHESIREAAAAALGAMCDRNTSATLRRARKDSSAAVKRAADRTYRKCNF